MMRRIPPPRYHASEGRLLAYDVSFAATDTLPANIWSFNLNKTYIPWETWETYASGGPPRLPSTPPSFVEGPTALKTLPKEHERTLEDITLRIQRETDEVEKQGWTFPAYQRHFRFLSPAMIDAFTDLLPYLQDPGAYHWDNLKNILMAYVKAAALDYPRLSDPDYFEARRLDALSLWGTLDCISQTMAAKWELGFGECENNPDPNDFRLGNLDPATEVGGWMLNHFPSLRDGELPMPLSQFVELHRVELQPQQALGNTDALGMRFGPAAVADLFGQVWERRFGYDALLTDLEQTLASPEQLIGLGWLYDHRAMR